MICNMPPTYVKCSERYVLLIAAQLFGLLDGDLNLPNVHWNYFNASSSNYNIPSSLCNIFIDFILEFGFAQIIVDFLTNLRCILYKSPFI